MKRGGSAICRLSGRIAVTLVSFRKRMAPSRQCNGATGGNRIIAEFSMPPRRLRWPPHHEPGQVPSWVVLRVL